MQIAATNAYSSAMSGMLAAKARLDDDAAKIAADPFDVDALVDATFAPIAVAANAQVFRAADESTQALFDAFA